MKKIVSLLLSLTLVFSAVSIALTVSAEDSSDETLRVAVASDLHYCQPREEISGDIDDELFFYANRRASMDDESGFIIDEFLRQCKENKDNIDYVLIPGDMADSGRQIIQEHYDVAAKLAAFEEETGIPVYVTNGNHDCCDGANGETSNEQFREIYKDFGYSEALATDEGTLSYTVNLGDKYRLIVGDSCDASVSTEDGLTSDRVDWIVEQAKLALSEGRYPVLMMHHNLLEHMPVQRILSHNFIVRNHTVTAERFANAGIKAVFTGHEHGSDVMSYTSTLGNTITDFSTTSLTMYPLEYRYITFTPETITYESKSIENIDFDALYATCAGYTDAQKAAMQSDYTEYSKQYFKASIRYRLWLSLTPEKLGVDEDAFYGDIVYTAVNGLLDIMEMPLYGENSVQALAEEYGIEIPASRYEDGWDVATEVVSYHYAGEEPFAMDSVEITLVLRIADLILLDALSSVNDECFLSAANSILSYLGTDSVCKDFTKAAANIAGPVTAGEYFIVAIASPILYGLAYDRDDLNDNDGTIDGYAVNNNSENIKTNITAKFNKFTLYMSMFFKYILKIFRISL